MDSFGPRKARALRRSALSMLLALGLAAPALAGPADAVRVAERDASGAPAPESVTLPARLDDDRLFVVLDFVTPDGRTRPALAWVNMGMSTFTLADGLRRELGDQALRVRAGGIEMTVGPEAVRSADAAAFARMLGPMPVEAVLPASALSKFRVTLDYGARTLTLSRRLDGPAPAGALAAPIRVNPGTGVASVEARVDGRAYSVVLDCGAGYSWWRGEIVKDWLRRHPDWLRAEGAPGQSNQAMTGEAFEHAGVTVRAPEIALGEVRLASVGVLGAGAGAGSPLDAVKAAAFWSLWGSAAVAPPSGWIGGAALKDYSLTLDYAHGLSYWRAEAPAGADDLQSVAISLVRGVDGYSVGGRVRARTGSAPAAIAPGDALVSIDGRPAAPMTRGEIIAALHGAPGETRRLVLEHKGERYAVDAPVIDFEARP